MIDGRVKEGFTSVPPPGGWSGQPSGDYHRRINGGGKERRALRKGINTKLKQASGFKISTGISKDTTTTTPSALRNSSTPPNGLNSALHSGIPRNLVLHDLPDSDTAA